MGIVLGIKNQKGTVSVENFKNRIRLRWRYQGKRFSLSLWHYSKVNLLEARKVALQIERDILLNSFDPNLGKYGGRGAARAGGVGKIKETFVDQFEFWVKNYKQMDCELHTNYNSTRNMLKNWGQITESNIQQKLASQKNAAVTYNRRLSILKGFIKWLVKIGSWKHNPLEDINPKRVKKPDLPKRTPFSITEIQLILDAIKNDTYSPKCSSFKHSHYYHFLYFMFSTGVRNAEAIGLRVGNIDLLNNIITIKEVLARSLVSQSSVGRIRKETKNGKVRYLPLSMDLKLILMPILKDKQQDDLVFTSPKGKAIDDKNFQNRIFKRVLRQLGIKERVIYAIRHTFSSRCIDSGLTPVQTAFLMGNNPETALRNYTHQMSIPKDLPEI